MRAFVATSAIMALFVRIFAAVCEKRVPFVAKFMHPPPAFVPEAPHARLGSLLGVGHDVDIGVQSPFWVPFWGLRRKRGARRCFSVWNPRVSYIPRSI